MRVGAIWISRPVNPIKCTKNNDFSADERPVRAGTPLAFSTSLHDVRRARGHVPDKCAAILSGTIEANKQPDGKQGMPVNFIYAFAMAMGFVLAGLAGSFYKLVTNRRLSFELTDVARHQLVLGFFMLMFAGPVVIMRNAIRGRLIERRAFYWLILSTLIAVLWSFLAGTTLINGLNALDG